MTLLRVKKQLIEEQDAMNSEAQHLLTTGSKPGVDFQRQYDWVVQHIALCNSTLDTCSDALRGRYDTRHREVGLSYQFFFWKKKERKKERKERKKERKKKAKRG